jgi:thiol-disulfide isomerase/thioredoxin
MASRRDSLIMLGVGLGAAGLGLWLGPRLAEQFPPADLNALRNARLSDLDGKQRRIDEWRGRILVCNFWATWCPPCLEEIPAFMRVRQATVARGVEFVGIAIDQADKVSQFAKKLGISYPVLLADAGGIALIRQLGNSSGGLPFTLILDRQGNIAARKLGAATQQEIEALLLPMLATRSG